jgi:anti-sigma factor RsiW
MRVECDRFDRWASLYRDFRLPGRARTAVERHLGYCKVCAARYEAYTASLDAARTEPTASSLIPADVTHEIPARPTSDIAPVWRGRVGGLAVWLLGVGMLLALLAAAFVLGFRAGTRSSRPDPTPVVERSAPRLVSLR